MTQFSHGDVVAAEICDTPTCSSPTHGVTIAQHVHKILRHLIGKRAGTYECPTCSELEALMHYHYCAEFDAFFAFVEPLLEETPLGHSDDPKRIAAGFRVSFLLHRLRREGRDGVGDPLRANDMTLQQVLRHRLPPRLASVWGPNESAWWESRVRSDALILASGVLIERMRDVKCRSAKDKKALACLMTCMNSRIPTSVAREHLAPYFLRLRP